MVDRYLVYRVVDSVLKVEELVNSFSSETMAKLFAFRHLRGLTQFYPYCEVKIVYERLEEDEEPSFIKVVRHLICWNYQ